MPDELQQHLCDLCGGWRKLLLKLGRQPVIPQNIDGKTVNPTDGAELVLIPAGEFLMGSTAGDVSNNERPQRTVFLSEYWMYHTPVTVAQYRMFCEVTRRRMTPEPSWKWQDDHPIVNVTWKDAAAYARWAGAALPTEAQWEKAARGMDGREYPWGNAWDTRKVQCSRVEWGDANSTAPVRRHPAGASPYGCLDMAGNVWEWCADWYQGNYYQTAPTTDPVGPARGDMRVTRGGSWFNYYPGYFSASYRAFGYPVKRHNGFGFRCVVRSPRP